MTSSGRETFDDRLADALSATTAVPADFTYQVLRRIQEERWRREAFLDRVFYGGLCAAGVLAMVGMWFALGAVSGPTGLRLPAVADFSGDVAMKLGIAGLVLTAVATWRRLVRQNG